MLERIKDTRLIVRAISHNVAHNSTLLSLPLTTLLKRIAHPCSGSGTFLTCVKNRLASWATAGLDVHLLGYRTSCCSQQTSGDTRISATRSEATFNRKLGPAAASRHKATLTRHRSLIIKRDPTSHANKQSGPDTPRAERQHQTKNASAASARPY